MKVTLRLVVGAQMPSTSFGTTMVVWDSGRSSNPITASNHIKCGDGDAKCEAIFDFEVAEDFLSAMKEGSALIFGDGRVTGSVAWRLPLSGFQSALTKWKPTNGYPADLKEVPAAFRAWQTVVRPDLRNEYWIYSLKGVADPMTVTNIAGRSYYSGSVCKPHDCADNNLAFLAAADGSDAAGIVMTWSGCQRLQTVTFGKPNAEQRLRLDELIRYSRRNLGCR
jgi:hypothetical protein